MSFRDLSGAQSRSAESVQNQLVTKKWDSDSSNEIKGFFAKSVPPDLAALLGDTPQKERAAEGATSNGSKLGKKNERRSVFDTTDPAQAPENLLCALAHAAAGRPVFPCRADNKRPLTEHGFKDATRDPGQIRRWWREWPDAMPGIQMGRSSGLAVLDLDRRPDKDGEAALRADGLNPDTLSPVSVVTPSGGRHLYFRWHEGLACSAGKIAPGVDVRGEGGYVIAPGAVSAAGAYSAADPTPADLPAWPTSLPIEKRPDWRDELAELLGDGDDSDLWADYAEAKRERDWEPDRIRSALRAITDASDRDTWLQIGMALHHASGGADAGFDLWCRWSRRCPDKFNERDQRRSWKSFGKRGGGVTIASLYRIAKGYGWDPAAPLPGSDEALAALLGESKPATVDSPLTFLSPAECAQSNPRPYIIKGLIAERDVACIVGAPGAGKSVLAPSLAYAVAQGREAHGRRTKAGRVFYVAAEDEHGMRGRVTALRAEHGDAANFTLVGGVTDLLNEAVAGQGSPHFNALIKAVEAQRPNLIVIDTLSKAFPGLEENSAEAMGRVVAVASALTKWGAAVFLIHHDTKDGLQGLPRGHSLLNGALDVSIHLRKEDDGTVRGRLTKNRNGACDAQLAFSIRGVEIGRDEDGDSVTAPLCQPLNPNALREVGPRLKPTERAALDSIVEMMGDGEEIDLASWRKRAIEGNRVSASESRDGRRMAVNRALQGLERAGAIEIDGGLIRIPDGIEWDQSCEDDEGCDEQGEQVNEHEHVQLVHPAKRRREANKLNMAL